jgi:hypothetical protein
MYACIIFIYIYIHTYVVGIATSYGLDDRGVGVRVPVRSRIFSSPNRPDGSEIHPTSYPMGMYV